MHWRSAASRNTHKQKWWQREKSRIFTIANGGHLTHSRFHRTVIRRFFFSAYLLAAQISACNSTAFGCGLFWFSEFFAIVIETVVIYCLQLHRIDALQFEGGVEWMVSWFFSSAEVNLSLEWFFWGSNCQHDRIHRNHSLRCDSYKYSIGFTMLDLQKWSTIAW